MTGIPPFAGFVGKLMLFAAAIDAQFTWLAVVAIANSVLSLAVYLRIVVPMYRRAEPAIAAAGTWPGIVALTAFAATVGIGLAAQLLLAGPMAWASWPS